MNRVESKVEASRLEGATGMRKRWLLAAVVALSAACAHQAPTVAPEGPPAKGPPVNLSGYSPAFKEGFGDGCKTARDRSTKNERRYAENGQYRRGWDDGRAICGRR